MTYTELPDEVKAVMTEEQFNALQQIFELDEDGMPSLKVELPSV